MRAEGDCVNSSRILEHLDAWQGQCLVLTIVVILAIEWLGRNLSLWLVMKAFGTKTAGSTIPVLLQSALSTTSFPISWLPSSPVLESMA